MDSSIYIGRTALRWSFRVVYDCYYLPSLEPQWGRGDPEYYLFESSNLSQHIALIIIIVEFPYLYGGL
jgi:hypothetical protein